jgi:hypothetical protein
MDYVLKVERDRIIASLDDEKKIDKVQMKGIQEGINSNKFKNFIDFGFNHMNSTVNLEYFSGNLITLNQFLSASKKRSKGITKNELSDLFTQIVDVMMLPMEYFYVSSNNVLLNFDCIYYDNVERIVKLMYLPSIDDQFDNKKELKDLFGKICVFIDEDDSETLQYFARINIYLNNAENYEFSELKEKISILNKNINIKSEKPEQIIAPEPSNSVVDSIEPLVKEKRKKKEIIESSGVSRRRNKKNKKTMINLILSEIILVAVIGLVIMSGIFKDDIVKLVGLIMIIAGLGEYAIYKLIYSKGSDASTDIVREEKKKNDNSDNKKVSVKKPFNKKKASNDDYDEVLPDKGRGTVIINNDNVKEVNSSNTVLIADNKKAVIEYSLNGVSYSREIDKTNFKIGKKESIVDHTIDSKYISGHHGTFYNQAGTFYYEDNDSTNKSYISGRELLPHKKEILNEETHMKLANVECKVRIY